MTDKILFVDDEPNVLQGLERQLRRRFAVATAGSGAEGLRAVAEQGPFAVIVSDMRMPAMSGAEFLARVREIEPDSVRMILSGAAELDSTIEAVNQGNIFRFLTKPCPTEVLVQGLETALEQYRLVVAERELLEETLSGAVRVLTELLELVNPEAFSRASRVQQYAEAIAESLGLPDRWQVRLAAMLSQIGCVTLPADTLAKHEAGQELSEEERRMVASHPELAGRLLSRIPRLEPVARMIARQNEAPDPAAPAGDRQGREGERLGGQILRAAIGFDRLLTRGAAPGEALERLKREAPDLPPPLLEALAGVRLVRPQTESRAVKVSELKLAMVLDQDVMTRTGIRVMPRGQEVTDTVLMRLGNFAQGVGIVEPIRVQVPR